MSEPTPLAAFSQLAAPVLYMVGGRSPASSRGVFDLLKTTLPHVRVRQFDDLGHMGPVTHPEVVNRSVEEHLAQ
jgi:pimeloyl-ACP methyl ester carboxylesterase